MRSTVAAAVAIDVVSLLFGLPLRQIASGIRLISSLISPVLSAPEQRHFATS